MRKSGFLALAGAALVGMAACQKSPQLSGMLPLEDSTKIYLFDIRDEKPRRVDSTLVENSMFTFGGDYAPGIYLVNVPGKAKYMVELSPSQPSAIVVAGSMDAPAAIGGPNGEALTELERLDAELNRKTQPLRDRYRELRGEEETPEVLAELEQLSEEYDSLTSTAMEEQLNTIHSMEKGAMSAYLLWSMLKDMTADQQVEVKGWLVSLGESLGDNAHVVAMRKHFATEASLQPGEPFIDFEAHDREGQVVRLSDYAGRGKVVLLEMWASWCGYCRKANPSLVEVYKEFADKGYEVFGISLDKDHDSWEKAVAEDALPWPNFIVLSGGDEAHRKANYPGDLYNVRGIPSNMLFDAEGKIVARNVDAEALRGHLNTLLTK